MWTGLNISFLTIYIQIIDGHVGKQKTLNASQEFREERSTSAITH